MKTFNGLRAANKLSVLEWLKKEDAIVREMKKEFKNYEFAPAHIYFVEKLPTKVKKLAFFMLKYIYRFYL